MNFLLLLISLITHDFHVSKCLVEYNEKNKSIEISLHLFLDDFEDALKYIGGKNLFLCTEKENLEAEEWIATYLKRKFKLELNGHPIDFQYLGKEQASDLMSVWCYMEITDIQEFSEITITNEILLEIFDDQKNIISLIGPGKKKEMMISAKGGVTHSVRF